MKTKLLLLTFLMSSILSIQHTQAQTVLLPGDIAIIWYQADTPDSFAFATFVDLDAGTEIIFTDCGAVPAGTFDPAGCGEGAIVYTVPASGLLAGEIVTYDDSLPGVDFVDFAGDAVITGTTGMALSTGGDHITVLQGTPSSPNFIFMLSGSSTTFSGDDSVSTTETNLFTGLIDTGLPRTAVAVGSGPAPSQEWDNAVYTGGYTFATVADAKIAVTDPANFVGVNAITDAPYNGLVAGMPEKFTILALSVDEFDLGNSIFISPNPSNGIVTIKNSGIALETAVLTDINGRTIQSFNLNGVTQDKELDLSAVVSSGLYFVTISSETASTVKKIIIQ
ncbi:T9SS type A sorting domain-containing protein [Psychroserpens algicola]|uniref:T9SS type A sorting domain-containing protein n=1 Tax=Psychroserpens algicola TaxID=1719034 RepID=A0ABT0H4E9_9FLAO|nr:T9SS type A sorting domain-containing protein [Psychroserpens algicola]MCK8479264.1 T9SS type A sorting domain-containing protein [Psychroserpens algicola]